MSATATSSLASPDEQLPGGVVPAPDSARCHRGVEVFDTDELRWVKVRCKRRTCPHCGRAVWVPSVLRRLRHGLGGSARSYTLLLLTAPGTAEGQRRLSAELPGVPMPEPIETAEEMAAWNASAAHRWNRFMSNLVEVSDRNVSGRWTLHAPRLEFFRVAELQARGAIHYHVVIRGLGWVPLEELTRIATRAGFGPIVRVRKPDARKGGVAGLRSYLAKYLLKGAATWAVGGTRMWSRSRGWVVAEPVEDVWRQAGRYVWLPWGMGWGRWATWLGGGRARDPIETVGQRMGRLIGDVPNGTVLGSGWGSYSPE